MSKTVVTDAHRRRAAALLAGLSGAVVPFTLWPAQAELLPRLTEKRLFALKARQLGITWLDLAHWLYEATFWGSRLILVARQTHEDALDAIHRLKVLRGGLPSEWQARVVVDRRQSLSFANGSRFKALATTKRMGRSHAAYGALIDEFRFFDAQEEELAAIEAACERIHIVSSGNGAGDHAHALWRAAEKGEGLWSILFLPWSAHPGRDEAWYARTVLAAASPPLARREYAATPEEAFAAPRAYSSTGRRAAGDAREAASPSVAGGGGWSSENGRHRWKRTWVTPVAGGPSGWCLRGRGAGHAQPA